jgi:hypothetical protein
VYGIHVMTEEFPTQKILVREHLGVMDVCKGERLAVWLDGWVAVKVKRLDAPSHSLEK